MSLSERQAWMVLNCLQHIGPVSIRRILDRVGGDPRAVFEADRNTLLGVSGVGPKAADAILQWDRHVDLERVESLVEKHRAGFVSCSDPDYPERLRQLYDPPTGLFWRGAYRLDRPAVAIVGTRRPTVYGRGVARKLAGELARMDFCVVSGLARGIDSEAHRGALEHGGRTVAVLGNGLDIVYPPENLDLYREIAEEGAVVSEFPFGRRADRQTFPMRNRIVAGMSVAVVVVETARSGGSLITARFAMEQGRTVFAVPGRIDQVSSEGCHDLIRDGARIFTRVEDLLDELGYLGQLKLSLASESAADDSGEADDLAGLDDHERGVAELFSGGGTLHPDEISERLEQPHHEVAALLVMLELKKRVVKQADGSYAWR